MDRRLALGYLSEAFMVWVTFLLTIVMHVHVAPLIRLLASA